MKLEIYQVDAFTDEIFGGNPACVVPLQEWLSDEILLKIAKENAVSETAFFTTQGENFHLRWFTPEIEMDLCGHATLAAAHVIKTQLNYTANLLTFETLSGDLAVICDENTYTLDFPSRMPERAELPDNLKKALNILPNEVLKSRDYVLVYTSESDIRNIKLNRAVFDEINLDPGGVIVTAEGNSCDFVSRFFTPQATILEDPVTGSAHCSLIPYWAQKLKKNELHALQISQRQGELFCKDVGERVWIKGKAKTYSAGHFWIE